MLNWITRFLYGARLTDEATCYKAMSTALLREMRLQCERFEFCPEVTAKSCRLGITIREVAVSYAPRSASAGKKIRWRDGISAIRTLWRWRNWRIEDERSGLAFDDHKAMDPTTFAYNGPGNS